MITEKSFKVRCKKCRSWCYPVPIRGFNDRVRFLCINEPMGHKSVIKLVRKIGTKKLERYERDTKRSLALHNLFLDSLECYLEFQNENGEDFDIETEKFWKEKCKKCPKKMKDFCDAIDILNEVSCVNQRKKK